VPELDFTVRQALDAMSVDVTLPAIYDALTPEQRRWARGEYARLQGGLCCHCRAPLSGPPSVDVQNKILSREYPPGFFAWALHLHHNHQTGLTIGTVHARCNAVLWEYHGE
jgi:hypothetical protein